MDIEKTEKTSSPFYLPSLFDRLATKYEKRNQCMTLGFMNYWYKEYGKFIVDYTVEIALDLCCGTGICTEIIAEKVALKKVVGIDFSKRMLKIANQRKHKNMLFICDDVTHLPFENESIDYVSISFGLRNVQQKHELMTEVHRVLKSQGVFICMEITPPSNFFTLFLFKAYFKYVLPVISKVFFHEKELYGWLSQTALTFYSLPQLVRFISSHPFTIKKIKRLNWGIITLIAAQKNHY